MSDSAAKAANSAKTAPGRPFQKGQSGNPSGRPKLDVHIRELARQHTDVAMRTLIRIASDKGAPPAAQVSAAQALLDRGWGKPSQPVTGEDGAPLIPHTIRYEFAGG